MIKYITHPNFYLPDHAGRKVWAMGYTQNETTILHPFECYLAVSEDIPTGDTFLSLTTVDEFGRVSDVMIDDEDTDLETGNTREAKTLIFLSFSEESLFDISLVKTIQEMMRDKVTQAVDYRIKEGLNPEDVFFVVQREETTT